MDNADNTWASGLIAEGLADTSLRLRIILSPTTCCWSPRMNVMGASVTPFNRSLWLHIGVFSRLIELAYSGLTRYVSGFLTRAVSFHISGVRKPISPHSAREYDTFPRRPVSHFPRRVARVCRDASMSRCISLVGDVWVLHSGGHLGSTGEVTERDRFCWQTEPFRGFLSHTKPRGRAALFNRSGPIYLLCFIILTSLLCYCKLCWCTR